MELATTYTTPKKIFLKKQKKTNKHEMIVHLNQKLGDEKGLLQFANLYVFDTATSQFV